MLGLGGTRLANGYSRQLDSSPEQDGLQNADIEGGSTQVLPRPTLYSHLRPDPMLDPRKPQPFYCKKSRKVVIHFEFAPLTGE